MYKYWCFVLYMSKLSSAPTLVSVNTTVKYQLPYFSKYFIRSFPRNETYSYTYWRLPVIIRRYMQHHNFVGPGWLG